MGLHLWNQIVGKIRPGRCTALIAAEKTGRRACLIEIDPRYVDVTIKRGQNLTRRTAACAAVGTPYPHTNRPKF